MNVRLLKAMQKCCDNKSSFATETVYGRPVLTRGELCATDKIVAVRYREDSWRKLELPDGNAGVPVERLGSLNPSAEVVPDPSGFRLPDGRVVKRDYGTYPDLGDLWETLTRPVTTLEGGSPITDPKHLRRVLAVFDAAGAKPEIRNTGGVLTLDGWNESCEVHALVCGCRR